MAGDLTVDLAGVSQALGIERAAVTAVVNLLDAGNTIPFITRYRKDQTGGMDEEQIRRIEALVVRWRLLAERKRTILRSIESQGKLTPEIAAAITNADTTRQLEDLYLPYKPKKQTLATVARGRGLEPLANEILAGIGSSEALDARAADFVNPDRQVMSPADALLGAGHILAETFSERADLRGRLRSIVLRTGRLVTLRGEQTAVEEEKELPAAAESAPQPDPAPGIQQPVDELPSGGELPASGDAAAAGEGQATGEGQIAAPSPPIPVEQAQGRRPAKRSKGKPGRDKDKDLAKAFRDYFAYDEALDKIPPHRVLAINRGERLKVLRVKVAADTAGLEQCADEVLVAGDHPHADFLRGCGRDAVARLIEPSLEREIRRDLTDRAESHAVRVFARNLRNLLLEPPIRDRRVLAIDPGYRSGCKLAALDEFGNLLDQAVIHLVGSAELREQARARLVELVRTHGLGVAAIGNGTACRETEKWVAELISGELQDTNLAYVIVNEAGASVYSTSRLGREELPEYDATLRGAISIGRRLQDPLSELVKIDPASIGVGLYQHDMKAKHLRESLDAVVESCVNYVGVDLNTASPALLRYVSGMNQLTAQRVYDHRRSHGPFRNREQLKEVSGIGEATFVQAAGFLKIAVGDQPLDATWIHPESYLVATQVLERLAASPGDLAAKERTADLTRRLDELDMTALATEWKVGSMTLADIVAQLARPGRDPRESLPPPVFRHGVLKIDDLSPGLELSGTVLNVVDFGAFVDIGLKDTGLVHISQMANQYVADPHDLVAVGTVIKVWVRTIDKERRRVSLTMVDPALRKQAEEARAARIERSRKPQGQRVGAQSAAAQPTSEGAATDQGPPRSHSGRRGRKPPPTAAGPPPRREKPRPVVPITKAMKEGREPLRTFGDLKQFLDQQQESPADGEASQ